MMAKPTAVSMRRLKRIARYLKGVPRMVQHFRPSGPCQEVVVIVDSDWAGCKRTRKSTSGGVARLGKSVLKPLAATQSVIALSSGEAAYYGLVKGRSTGLGMKGMLDDAGSNMY